MYISEALKKNTFEKEVFIIITGTESITTARKYQPISESLKYIPATIGMIFKLIAFRLSESTPKETKFAFSLTILLNLENDIKSNKFPVFI